MTLPTHLSATTAAFLASGKGLLAADESFPTIGKRFEALSIPSTEENRRAYRELLFTTPSLSESISGVILFDETMRQRIGDLSMPEFLARQGMIPGIKVDAGTQPLPNSKDEKITVGLDGLEVRLAEYRRLGARFTKWRAVITIGDNLPTTACIDANADALARFARLSQEAGLVPIVEPEVLMDGAHTLEDCEDVTRATLKNVFVTLFEHRVSLDTMLLKTGMILPGKDCPQQASPDEIADATLRCLRESVPSSVPGIVFLSGGQSDVAATERLNAICRHDDLPWKLSFSFGRALQDPAQKAWRGQPGNVMAAQSALHHRALCNGLAVQGKYSVEAECEAA